MWHGGVNARVKNPWSVASKNESRRDRDCNQKGAIKSPTESQWRTKRKPYYKGLSVSYSSAYICNIYISVLAVSVQYRCTLWKTFLKTFSSGQEAFWKYFLKQFSGAPALHEREMKKLQKVMKNFSYPSPIMAKIFISICKILFF